MPFYFNAKFQICSIIIADFKIGEVIFQILTYSITISVFRNLSQVSAMETFYKNSWQFLASNYFCKKLYHRCLKVS